MRERTLFLTKHKAQLIIFGRYFRKTGIQQEEKIRRPVKFAIFFPLKIGILQF